MKTIIIYDNDGMIIYQASGDIRKPNGLPYLEVEIPIGRRIVSVDVINKLPIYEDIPKSEVKILSDKISILEDAQKQQDQVLLDNTYKIAMIEFNTSTTI